MAGEDVLVGLVLGVVLMLLLNPMKGLVFVILNQRQQIAFLTEKNGASEEFPNRKEDS